MVTLLFALDDEGLHKTELEGIIVHEHTIHPT